MSHTLSQPSRRVPPSVPKPLLYGAAFLMLSTVAIAATARLTGYEPQGTAPDTAAYESRKLVLLPRGAGQGVRLLAPDGTVIAEMTEREAGFVSVVTSALAFERKRERVAVTKPVELIRWADGRLTLRDPETGWRVELSGFGDANEAAFARLMPAG